jgi:hypothetical protein
MTHILCDALFHLSVSALILLVVHSLTAAGRPVRQSSRALFSKFIHLRGMKSPLSCASGSNSAAEKRIPWTQLVLACKVPNGAVEERGRLMAHPHQARRKKADGDRMDRFFSISLITDHRRKQHLRFGVSPLMKDNYSCCQATRFKLDDNKAVFSIYMQIQKW